MDATHLQTDAEEGHRLHKPGVAGSSPAAASPHQSPLICHTPAGEYHGWPQVSCSQLKALRESPLAYYYRFVARSHAGPKSDSLSFGTLFHTWAELGPDAFWPLVVVAPDSLTTSTGALSKKADEWLKNLEPGAIPISPKDEATLRGQERELLKNPRVRKLMRERIDAEFNIRTQWNGHDVRCRVDGATPTYLFDWKTTSDHAPMRDWFRSAIKYGYHLQSAFYQHCAQQCGWPDERMRFIVTSTVWPYECEVVVFPHELIERGRKQCVRLLDELRNRLDWDCWTNLNSQEVCELYVPAYAMRGE